MRRRFSQWPSALENPLAIAERCSVELDFSKFHLPHYEVPPGYTYESYLEHLCREALAQRYPRITPEHAARRQYELEVLKSKEHAAYLLLVGDFLRYGRSLVIMSQARVAAARARAGAAAPGELCRPHADHRGTEGGGLLPA